MLTVAALLAASLLVLGLIVGVRLVEAHAWRSSLVAIELRLPVGLRVEDIGQWLNTVAAATHPPNGNLLSGSPIALEVTADRHGIRRFLLVPRQLRATVLGGLRAALPGVRVEDRPDYLRQRPVLTLGLEARLTEQRRPTATERATGTANALVATLQPLQGNEIIVVQTLVCSSGTPAPVPSQPSSGKGDLSLWFTDELTDGEAIRAARLKQSTAPLNATIRVGVHASTTAGAFVILGRVFGQLRGMNASGVQVARRWLPSAWAIERLRNFVLPVAHWPLRLGTSELAGLLPIPIGEVALPGESLGMARQLPPPPGLAKRGVQIGVSNYPDMRTPLRLSTVDRLKHLHVIGPTGTGKSTLLANLILQDIEAGHGVIAIDPKSDLVADVLTRMPESRLKDVIVLDPAATERPLGFNLLQAGHDEQSRELVVDHVIHIWHELYEDFWGPRSEDVLRGALLTLINTKGANGEAFTLIEAPELLTATAFRKFVTEQATVPAGLASFWHWYRGIRPDERLRVTGPILNKLRAFTLRTPIRLMLGQAQGIDLDTVLAERKVLLVPLSASTLGAETAGLLGAVLLAGVYFAILRRATLPASERRPIFVHIDEAQTVLKLPIDMADALAQARGMGASFTISHQYLDQIEDKLTLAALVGTVRNQVVFQCLRPDAEELAKSYAPWLSPADLMGLAPYEIAVRATVDNQALAPFTGTTLPLPPSLRDGQAVAEASRQRYGQRRPDVEAALKARGHAPEADKPAGSQPKGTGSPNQFGRRRKPSVDRERGAT